MLTLRPAGPADVPAVDALLRRSFPALLQADYPADVLQAALPDIARAQPDLVSCGTYYVVENGSRLLGAGGWTRAAPGSGQVTSDTAYIRHVVTDPDATRRGVARLLLDHVIATTAAEGLHRLHCTATRTAVPFYRAMGFAQGEEVQIPLPSGTAFPAVEMWRIL